MKKKLTLTIESKITDKTVYPKLEEYSSFYTHLEKKLFNVLVNNEINKDFHKSLKREWVAKYKIHDRLFNALWVSVKGKLDSLKELQSQNQKNIKKRIKELQKKKLSF